MFRLGRSPKRCCPFGPPAANANIPKPKPGAHPNPSTDQSICEQVGLQPRLEAIHIGRENIMLGKIVPLQNSSWKK